MPPARRRRARTGNHRRTAMRNTQCDYRADRGLGAGQMSTLMTIQQCIGQCLISAHTFLQFGIISMLIRTLVLQNIFVQDINILNALIDGSVIAAFGSMMYGSHWIQQDFDLADIDPNEEEPADYGPSKLRRINILSNHQCRDMTRFNKSQLRRLYQLIGLHGRYNVSGYVMTGEEILLFSLTKIAHGLTNRQLCQHYFGGNVCRWSHAYPLCLRYLSNRYKPILGIPGLARFVPHFPIFARRIGEKMNKDRFYIDPVTGVETIIPGLGIDPENCRIFGFIDGSIFETSTPGTGPDGDYFGAGRKPDAYFIQRAVYTGYKKIHGISMLCIMLPNGINFCYGPCSAKA